MVIGTIQPRDTEAESETPEAENKAVSGSPKKRILIISTICLFIVVGLSYLAGLLIFDVMVTPMAGVEAERVASHLRRVFRNIDSEIFWNDPYSPEAAEIFEQIQRNPLFVYRERLRDFKVWDNTGKRIWPIEKSKSGKLKYHYRRESITPENSVRYEFESIGHDKKEKEKYQSNIVMETYVPIWRDGIEKSGTPDLIAEAYTDPLFIGDYILGGWNLIWVYTSIVGFIVYVILLAVLI